MSENKNTTASRPPLSPAATLRRIGLIILIAGVVVAALLYVLAPPVQRDPRLTEFYDQQDQAAQRMWGSNGSLLVHAIESLKHVRTYSGIVLVVAALGSFACFYLARDSYDGSPGGQMGRAAKGPTE